MDHVVQFDTERKTSPRLEIQLQARRNAGRLRGCWTGVARLKLSATEKAISRKKHQLITVKPDPICVKMNGWAIPWEVPVQISSTFLHHPRTIIFLVFGVLMDIIGAVVLD
ncbi:hypothetical protein A3B18_04120 [Candidatus Giovannonibacteria bacterium RIFCSPLOWO2_01_FULL_46_13]|uniref:Uncharacterized protein n=1 Tax=Candidatus Giovannonibacteria bacterium RIFCSPLOWO2_01_FULL_46_13 TaxID=1798352 RepID=A0A1F5X3P6_9BACT|nr:MAG: hypothetical protein A3B18_04120 [Candidatus Giovannonibacteria bacterium RIFCSPLOWO2_01_FULL_46_13]